MFGVSKIFALFERKFFWTTKFVGGILYNSLVGDERIETEQGTAHDGFVSAGWYSILYPREKTPICSHCGSRKRYSCLLQSFITRISTIINLVL